jgi:hypothetical protein
LDAAGILILEKFSGRIRRIAAEEARALGIGCSSPLYPGSAPGWDLSGQDDLVRLTGADAADPAAEGKTPPRGRLVRVSDRHLLIPRLSVSFLIGLGDYPHAEPPSSCSACGRENCPYRSA